MPLIIPPPRNLTREGLGAFFLSLQESRIREEERKRQEEAMDAGAGPLGGALGGAVGMGLGALLAAPTGGLSMLAGAAIGGGIGTAGGTGIGAAIQPAGRGYPGGTTGVVARGLAAGTQQVIGGLGIAAQGQQLREAREFRVAEAQRAREARTLPPRVSESDFEAFLETPLGKELGKPGSRQFLWDRTLEQQQARQIEFDVARQGALQTGKAETAKKLAVRDKPNEWIWEPAQVELQKSLKSTETIWKDRLAAAQADNDIAGVEAARQVLRNTRLRQDALALELNPKPPQPQNIRQLISKMPNAAFDGDPQTAQRAWVISDRGSVNEIDLEPVRPFQFPEGQGPYELFTIDGTTGYREPTGKPVKFGAAPKGAGEAPEFEFDYDKARKDITARLIAQQVPVLGPEGKPVRDDKGVVKTRPPTAEDIEKTLDTAAERQMLRERRLANQQILLESESRNELFATLERDDPKLKAARQLIQNWERVPYPDLVEAVQYVRDRIDEMAFIEDDRGNLVLADMPKTLRHDLAEYNELLKTILARRKIPFILGIR